MNRFENWFCGSWLWRRVTRTRLLPWLLEGTELGEHVLEIGAGPGAATPELRKRAGRATSLEYSHEFAAGIVRRDRSEWHDRRGDQVSGAGNSGKDVNRSDDATSTAGDIRNGNGEVVQGDASVLPFPDRTFSSAIAILVLHHLKSREAQEQAFAEVARVLQPGGVFLAVEIQDAWLNRVAHIRSTFVPLPPEELAGRLKAAGLSDVTMAHRGGGFRVNAVRPKAAA